MRVALKDLPKSLHVTYEHILCTIPAESKQLVYRAFAILASNTDEESVIVTPAGVAEAVRWTDADDGSPDDELLGMDAIFEMCICLLRKVKNTVAFAHYTVKEYLQSCSIQDGLAKEFYVSQDCAMRLGLRTRINRLMCHNNLNRRRSLTISLEGEDITTLIT